MVFWLLGALYAGGISAEHGLVGAQANKKRCVSHTPVTQSLIQMALLLSTSARPRNILPAQCAPAGARIAQTALRPRPITSTVATRLSHGRRQARPKLPVCQGLFGLGLPEVALIAGVAALIFGPSKLPELGKSLGKTAKSFQNAAKEFEQELKEASKPDEAKAEPPKKE